jgi:hypothetical protein
VSQLFNIKKGCLFFFIRYVFVRWTSSKSVLNCEQTQTIRNYYHASKHRVRFENPNPLLEWSDRIRGNCNKCSSVKGNLCWYSVYAPEISRHYHFCPSKVPSGQGVLCMSLVRGHTDFLFINYILSTVSNSVTQSPVSMLQLLNKKYIWHKKLICYNTVQNAIAIRS